MNFLQSKTQLRAARVSLCRALARSIGAFNPLSALSTPVGLCISDATDATPTTQHVTENCTLCQTISFCHRLCIKQIRFLVVVVGRSVSRGKKKGDLREHGKNISQILKVCSAQGLKLLESWDVTNIRLWVPLRFHRRMGSLGCELIQLGVTPTTLLAAKIP